MINLAKNKKDKSYRNRNNSSSDAGKTVEPRFADELNTCMTPRCYGQFKNLGNNADDEQSNQDYLEG